jgi:hypothetical protein
MLPEDSARLGRALIQVPIQSVLLAVNDLDRETGRMSVVSK